MSKKNPLFLLLILFSAPLALAQTQESEIINEHWGLAAGTGWVQDYPGAAQGRTRYLVMPMYKSKYITVDRQEGVKGELIDENRFKFAVSFSFLFPTASRRIPVRQGMPNLDWVFQLGPEMQIFLQKTERQLTFLRIPLRFIATTDFKHNFEYRQWNFAPSLRHNYLLNGYGELMFRFEVDFASEGFSDLFYEVAPQYATAARPAYDARMGLLEYIVGINYSYNENFPWGYSIGGNIYIMNHAKNRNSPLFMKDTNFSILASVVRWF